MGAEPDYGPFEVVEEDERTILRLDGAKEQRERVQADKVHFIMDALAQGWDIDISYADIEGDLDVMMIDEKLERTEDGRPVIKAKITMFNCNIGGNANFVYAKFTGDAYFGSVKFSRDVHFAVAQFSGNAGFRHAQFSRDADFLSAEFTGDTDFMFAQFGGNANFMSAKFSGNASFLSAQFSGNANLRSAQFTGDADLRSAQFSGNADFMSAKFSRDVHFAVAQFGGNADFMFARFSGNANFMSAKFSGDANFMSAEFTGYAYFVSAQFSRGVHFAVAQFSGNADFMFAQFTEDTDFQSAKFTRDVNFRFAQFSAEGVASFATIETETLTSIDFYGSTFRCPVFFTGARIKGLLSLRRSLISAPISMLAADFDESSGKLNLVEAVLSAEIDVSWKQIGKPFLEHLEQFVQGEPSQKEYGRETRLDLAQAALVQLSRNFAKLGRTRDARLAGYAWIQLARGHSEQKIWRRLTDWLLDIPSNRGTRPWKPLVFGLAIILLAAAIFALGESMSWPFGTAAFEATKSSTTKAPWYYPFVFSVENFMPAMKPKLIGLWDVSQRYIWVAQLEAMLGWLWFGLTAWSIRESFF